MHKKHIFLRVFSKITIFACVFCVFSACADTTTCDIDYTPVTGNSIQNGTPTPTTPVEIESVGTKVGNKYAVQVAVNYDGGVVDLGTLNWTYDSDYRNNVFITKIPDFKYPPQGEYPSINTKSEDFVHNYVGIVGLISGRFRALPDSLFFCKEPYTDAASFKQAMSGKMFYYQRATDETWTAPTLKTVYLDEPLRKVGDYADVLDYKNGTITRNVGVKVLDGTESWVLSTDVGTRHRFTLSISSGVSGVTLSSHFIGGYGLPYINNHDDLNNAICIYAFNIYIVSRDFDDVTSFKSYLAAQYAAGTPVTIYYPLATPVVEQIENWSCTPPITDIKIATTKFVDEEFAQAEANLAATVQTIESVVSRTIAQTGQIATLQETKQTRPDESCPANMKCLLVQDEDGTPHWYPIIEP